MSARQHGTAERWFADVFTVVLDLFTSFGYILEDAQNVAVLRDIARVTAPGGWLVLDFLNACSLRDRAVPFDRTLVSSAWVRQEREITGDGRFIRKTIFLARRVGRGRIGRSNAFVKRPAPASRPVDAIPSVPPWWVDANVQ